VPEAATRTRDPNSPKRSAAKTAPVPVYLTWTAAGNPHGRMTADASIIIAQNPACCVCPALVQAGANDIAVVEVWADNQMAAEVQIGLTGDVYVEIMAG